MKRFWIILTVVIIGLVALFLLTDKKEDSTTTFAGDAKQVQSDDHVKYSRDKKVTLIEYGDFECPSCAQYYPVVKEVAEKYKDHVNVVFRNLPLRQIHANAQSAALAAEAAGKQGKFFEMHDKLYETQTSWRGNTASQQKLFESYAEELGLNMDQFKSDYMSKEVADKINRDNSSAKQFGAEGTPTFILNGEKIESPAGIAEFEKVLDEAIKKAGGTPPSAQ